jgi:hypothetical protein
VCGITAPGSSNLLTYALTNLFDIPRGEVGMVNQAFRIWAMFPLRAAQIRRSLPHVVGSPASEYYETICFDCSMVAKTGSIVIFSEASTIDNFT